MIRSFHDLRRHEEGQALVLAAISMLILTLCILSTVNLTFAAKERIRLQNTADAAAYTTAAYQARAMNFFAYTNRAMVVHYVSQMNMMANLSYMSCTAAIMQLIQQLTNSIPVIGVIFTVISIIYQVFAWLLNLLTFAAAIFVDAMNYGMSLAQFALWATMGLRVLGIPGEAVRKSDPNLKVEPIGAILGNLTPAGLGVSSVVNADPTPSLGTLLQPNDTNGTFNRLLMTEMANAGRSRFTAEGNGKFTLALIPRAFTLGGGFLTIGKAARTEMGSLRPTALGGVGGIINTVIGGIFTPTEQIFSVERFFIRFSIGRYYVELFVDLRSRADRAAFIRAINMIFGGAADKSRPIWMQAGVDDTSIPKLIKPLFSFLTAPLKTATSWLQQNINLPFWPVFFFGQVPYARFIPQPSVGPRGNNTGLFNQPPVMVAVTSPETYITSRGGPFMKRFGFPLGSMSSQTSTYDGYYSASTYKTPSKRGYVNAVDFNSGSTPFPLMSNGFHAVSAAMAYYHRPGDWREPPNLFNPFWGAKLMPVADYPTMRSNPLLRALFSTNLVAH